MPSDCIASLLIPSDCIAGLAPEGYNNNNNNNHLFVPRKDRDNYNLYFIKVEGTACPK